MTCSVACVVCFVRQSSCLLNCFRKRKFRARLRSLASVATTAFFRGPGCQMAVLRYYNARTILGVLVTASPLCGAPNLVKSVPLLKIHSMSAI
ncbi:hypothetical protein AUEXF2481DRAFT_507594 [Aureobasidium subglaciale EXF-2481]|uniref:Uncharacterized protein n=1 Tax=Aureobasidium subglaciale (strain EXF-2481) TaxID=1043005 RepID=A0A074Y5P8_AURSE|nr:uncharacterized protein AUEXF2481DRAFT_507594 [Aureobasidium subglaciale EXF-2481]KEQ91279.1 hypothetical protein AUEXF2481DRAFT_507594 [Aureobasidium subglaciale EXF-2481]